MQLFLDKSEEIWEREQLRQERHKYRERDRNLAPAAPDKRSRLQCERERDISEQIALGIPVRNLNSGEAQLDQRLLNTKKGLDSGFRHQDNYNIYDQPWKENTIGTQIYYPGNLDKQFSGTDKCNLRLGPVQFEKEKEEDPFGLVQFLKQAKEATGSNSQSKRKDDRDTRRDDRDKRRKH